MAVFSELDRFFMNMAIREAEKNIGLTGENPSVGCVIVHHGTVIGKASTGAGGVPHAEVLALQKAKRNQENFNGATAYVTLEPCSHHGKTPPCAAALIAAGIAEVKIAVIDPNPVVNGRGVKQLQAAGVKVEIGLCAAKAKETLKGFLFRQIYRRPFVTIKTGSSIDGRITDSRGCSKWITCESARAEANFSRMRYDAIAVGSGTVLADDPQLDCRAAGFERNSPDAVIFDSALRTPATAKIFSCPGRRVFFYHQMNEIPKKFSDIQKCDLFFIKTPAELDKPAAVRFALFDLAEKKIGNVLIEGGGTLISAFLQARLCDQLKIYRAGKILGANGTPAVASFESDLSHAIRFSVLRYERFENGDDLTVYQNLESEL